MPLTSAIDDLSQAGTDILASSSTGPLRRLQDVFLEGGGIRTAEDIDRIREESVVASNRSFDPAIGTIERQERGIGRDLPVSQRRIGLSRVLSAVDRTNRATDADLTQRRTIREAAGGLRDAVDSNMLGALRSAGFLETGREVEFDRRQAVADERRRAGLSSILGLVGTGVGGAVGGPIGASIGGSGGTAIGGLL